MAPLYCLDYGVTIEWLCEASLAWHLFAALTMVSQLSGLCEASLAWHLFAALTMVSCLSGCVRLHLLGTCLLS